MGFDPVTIGIGITVGAATGAVVSAIKGGDPLKGALFGGVTGGLGGFALGGLGCTASGTVSVLGTEMAKSTLYAGVAGALAGYSAGTAEAERKRLIREQQAQQNALRANESLLKAQMERDKAALDKEMAKMGIGSVRSKSIDERLNASRQFAELVDSNDAEELEKGLGNLYAAA